ncbi:MAG: site-specific DNA-methyltransferase [Candidatus Aenigmarchaeota archaeon]|nr:site-specific DNA-methyltransferase [Candidatus Aenigmarchaeota archaeon]
MSTKMQMLKINNEFSEQNNIILHHGDSYEFLKTIPIKTVKLIISSPPYNVGKIYEKRVKIEDYLKEQERVIGELVRILKDDGSICWEVGNFVDKSEVYPLDIFYYDIFKKHHLKLRNRIIWHFGHGLHASKRFSGRYETILWFTKTDNYTFNLDSVRVPSKYPGKTYYKGPKRGQPSGNPNGKNPSDIWEIVCNDWENEIWDIPNVKSNHPEKTIHPCQFPIELVERCVLALTNENDWVLDPYSGVGSALIAGLKHNRRVIGVDKESKYIDITEERIRKLYSGKLKIRPLGQPVYQPTGKEKVSQIPSEWKDENKQRRLL